MDERVNLTRKLNGASEVRISEVDLADLGQAGLARELSERGLHPDHMGTPKYDRHRMRWTIPVRTPDE